MLRNSTRRYAPPLRAAGRACGFVVGFWLLLAAGVTRGADLEAARALYSSGNYSQSVKVAREGLAEQPWSENWLALLTDGLLTTGQYGAAEAVITNTLNRGSATPHVRWLAREVFLANGRTPEAEEMVNRIIQSLASSRIDSATSLAALGQAALLKGLDPKLVLDRMYYPAKKADPNARAVYLAIGKLALDKHDYALAAKTFQEGLKQLPNDPDLLFGLATAFAPSDPALATETIAAALERNSNHIASLLLVADNAINAEAYPRANEFLDRVFKINPWNPEAWSYRAVLATLQNRPQEAITAQEKALKFWSTNPRVPHLIGLTLSQQYRFAEGSELQRLALIFDPNCQEAKVQLAQDLLRLGEEAEGWRLADEVQKADNYNVTANNLMTLHDTMLKFRVLTNEHFQLRMNTNEAALYGGRALELLSKARATLAPKYGTSLVKPTLVEVFTSQADFAVRTFAMPHNDGFLGVCFGNVITANSPAAYAGHPFNWEAMLWHEFGHVITLNLTHNKMPRWLSEGISVYEERQHNPAWGENLTPRYREMILEGDLKPIGKLSEAFQSPPTAEHLQFAYYQSSLVVEFIIERFGFTNLVAILRDLGDGAEINQSIARHTVSMGTLEQDFETYAKKLAMNMGPKLDWERPELGERQTSAQARVERLTPPSPDSEESIRAEGFDWATWAKAHPTNYYAMLVQAQESVEKQAWSEAKPILQSLIELCPEAREPYKLLAETHRALGETEAELKALEQLAQRESAATAAYQRLMELARERQDWAAVMLNARRYRAVNPLAPVAYRFLAEAGEKTGDVQASIEACRALLVLDPADPAELHYRLARLLKGVGDSSARREVLLALEEAPRYRDALRLLLELHKNEPSSNRPVAK
jgi:hypothetical protein